MKPLYESNHHQVFTDEANLLIIDADTLYLYCLYCGGIKTFHLFLEERREARAIVESVELVPLCHCHRPKIRPINRLDKDPVQQALANVFVGLGSCRSLADARLMVEEMASREEMRDVEQML